MNTKIIGFVFMLSLMFSPAFAQEESLLVEGDTPASTTTDADLFGGDLFNDLDSFFAEESGGTVANDPATEPISNPIEALPEETLQGSATLMPTTTAGVLPNSTEVSMSVLNVSQDNADASKVGARPGDVLRYEITLDSQTDDVVDYVPSINVSGIESVVEFTNTGFGVRENGTLVYPAYSHQAPCTQAFTFFVRVNESCGEMTSMSVTNSETGDVSVPLNCGLAKTGPSQILYLLAGLLMLALTIIFTVFGRRQSS